MNPGKRGEQERFYAVDHRELLEAAVAQLYHLELVHSLKAIAERLRIDRRLVRTYLEAARRHGLVDVRVHHPLRHRVDLGGRLRTLFPVLKDALVIETPTHRAHLKEEVGRAAAHALDQVISGLAGKAAGQKPLVIAVSWGGTVSEAARAPAMQRTDAPVVCVPAHGSTPISKGTELSTVLLSWQANEVARRLAERYRGTWYPLYVPAFVAKADVAKQLEQNSVASPVLDLARRADVVLVGIGTLDKNASFHVAGVLGERDLEEIKREKGVGDICGRFFRLDGSLCKWKLEQHIVGLKLEDLQSMVSRGRSVIGAAGGREKGPALLGAIEAGAVNHVITDAECCEGVIELVREK